MHLEVISRYPETSSGGPPLVFVHGSYADARCWDDHFLPYFAEHGYEAHALSLRGHGRSDGRLRLLTWRLADYVADLARVVDDLAQPPVLIGHSMGGMVIQKYLAAEPGAAAGMVLMASVPPDGLLPVNMRMAARHPLLFQQMVMLVTLGPATMTPFVMQRLLFSPRMPAARVWSLLERAQGESQAVGLDMLGLDPLRLDPDALTMPVLVMGARDDVLVAPSVIADTAAFYGVAPCLVPDLAHAMMMDLNWRSAAQEILRWLVAEVPAAAAGHALVP